MDLIRTNVKSPTCWQDSQRWDSCQNPTWNLAGDQFLLTQITKQQLYGQCLTLVQYKELLCVVRIYSTENGKESKESARAMNHYTSPSRLVTLKDTITANHRNFHFLTSTLYCQMPPRTPTKLIKRSHKTKLEQVF